MIVKEFRIVLPLTVEEYKIGQLFSVAKTSSQETSKGEGVEVIKNEPYKDDQSEGQYTEKIYHLGSRLPGWVKAILPASALKLEEKAWNAFPYCKTVLSNPFLGSKFTFIIESRHANDKGEQDNIHNLTPEQLKQREVDIIDIADNSKIDKKEYKAEEDPTLVRSEKANRGPLVGDWKDKDPTMCCYKLVTAEIKIWGMQTKGENFLMTFERNLFTKFHRQVYCWLDEWLGLSMQDVRDYEAKTKADLDDKIAEGQEGEEKKEEKK
eukprot:TRINITY_DN27228_c0_g1_i1.p1 TRINITY_DN27228_c0_g1~~TRINITY_DN27228_c0_g1_i1.p1  ORF type:complete len:266 (-),score=102.72 TRINITY_DN27228_c0_g1_i1:174-971(-)